MVWTSYLRHCAHCKRGFFVSVDVFCESCWKKLLEQKRIPNSLPIKVLNLDVYPLFIWSGENKILQDFLYALKGGGFKDVFDKIAVKLLCNYERHLSCANKNVVPIPPSRPGHHDHAYQLGKSIADQLECPLITNLVWQSKEGAQKHLTKAERMDRKMSLQNPSPIKAQAQILLVDDVITTGATVAAAAMAIEGPNSKEAWCIACRI